MMLPDDHMCIVYLLDSSVTALKIRSRSITVCPLIKQTDAQLG